MRRLLFSMVLIFFIAIDAQSQTSPMLWHNSPGMDLGSNRNYDDSLGMKKNWLWTKYAGLSASYGFFNGGNASVLSVPIGLQLNRRLNNNLYAFAGISAAPSYINFNRAFMNTDLNKMNTGNLALYSRFEAGLMYVNDQRTFSISGSIIVDRSTYPVYPYYNRTGLPGQQPMK